MKITQDNEGDKDRDGAIDLPGADALVVQKAEDRRSWAILPRPDALPGPLFHASAGHSARVVLATFDFLRSNGRKRRPM